METDSFFDIQTFGVEPSLLFADSSGDDFLETTPSAFQTGVPLFADSSGDDFLETFPSAFRMDVPLFADSPGDDFLGPAPSAVQMDVPSDRTDDIDSETRKFPEWLDASIYEFERLQSRVHELYLVARTEESRAQSDAIRPQLIKLRKSIRSIVSLRDPSKQISPAVREVLESLSEMNSKLRNRFPTPKSKSFRVYKGVSKAAIARRLRPKK